MVVQEEMRIELEVSLGLIELVTLDETLIVQQNLELYQTREFNGFNKHVRVR